MNTDSGDSSLPDDHDLHIDSTSTDNDNPRDNLDLIHNFMGLNNVWMEDHKQNINQIYIMYLGYQRLNVTEVTGEIIQSSIARLKTIQSYPKPRSRNDVTEIFSDTSRPKFNLFQEKPAEIMTIAAGIFDLHKRTWSIYINPPKLSEPVAVLPIAFTSLDY